MKFLAAVALLAVSAVSTAHADVSTTSCNSTTIKPWISSTFPGVTACIATGYNTLKYIVPTAELAETFCPSSDCRTIVTGTIAVKPATGDCYVKSNGVAINFYADLVEAWSTTCENVPTIVPTTAPPATTAPPETTAPPTTPPPTTEAPTTAPPSVSTTACNSTTIKPWISSTFPGVTACIATGYNTLMYIVPTAELATTFCPSSDCRTIVTGTLAVKPAVGDCYVKSNGVAINFYADLVEAWSKTCDGVVTNAPTTTEPPATTVPATTVPATTVPATTVPATTVPATTVPATTVPATTVPATTVPATTTPRPQC